jgi:hypothetical protein
MINAQLDPSMMKVLYKTPLVLEGQGGKSEGGDTGIMSLLQSGKSKTDTADAKYQDSTLPGTHSSGSQLQPMAEPHHHKCQQDILMPDNTAWISLA